MARRSRASLRHALLAVTFGALAALPFASTLIPPVGIEAPIATQEPARMEPPPAGERCPHGRRTRALLSRLRHLGGRAFRYPHCSLRDGSRGWPSFCYRWP
jgi:hypothetical protein